MKDSMYYEIDDAWHLRIDFAAHPPERATNDYPGYPGWIEINGIWLGGVNVMDGIFGQMSREDRKAYEDHLISCIKQQIEDWDEIQDGDCDFCGDWSRYLFDGVCAPCAHLYDNEQQLLGNQK